MEPLIRHAERPGPPALPPRQQVRDFVVEFYRAARADALLGPVFERVVGERWEAHYDTMTEFWLAVVFGGPAFRGNPMVRHASVRDIDAVHFERWLQIFGPVARRCWPPQTAALFEQRAAQIAPALLAGVGRARERGLVEALV